MSAKVFLGSLALITGAVVYEKSMKNPDHFSNRQEEDAWKYKNYYRDNNDADYPYKKSSNFEKDKEKFAKKVDAQQYDGRQNLLANERRGSYGIDDFYNNNNSNTGTASNIKNGFKDDAASLKNAIFHNHMNPPVSNFNRDKESATASIKNGLKEDVESLKHAVFHRHDDIKTKTKDLKENVSSSLNNNINNNNNDLYGNKTVLEKQLHNAEDEVTSLKKQLRSLDGKGDFTYDEQKAIDANKAFLPGFGENAAFFANEQYESVHGSPKHRFNTKEALPLLFDKNGRKLSDEEILRIQRDGLRGWGENAGWFADEQYRSRRDEAKLLNSKDKVSDKIDSWKSDLNSAKDEAVETADDWLAWGNKKLDHSHEKASEMKDSAKASINDTKRDFNEAKDDWKKWGTSKINETDDKFKDLRDDAKETTNSWWEWSKDATDKNLNNAKNKALDVADDTLKTTSNKFSKASDSLEEQRDFIQERKN